MTLPLSEVELNVAATIREVGGQRSFRRRLMEMGLVPGTAIMKTNVAPLGDPLEILVRGGKLSIRHGDASELVVEVPDVLPQVRAA